MKRLTYSALPITFLLLLFLCMPIMEFTSHAQADGSSAPPSRESDSAPIEITEIEVNKFKVNRMHLLMRGDSSASLDLPQLDGTINFYREGEGFAEEDVLYSVKYDTGDFDNTCGDQTGLFFLKAFVILEDERYVMAPDVSDEISIPIFIYDPDHPSVLPPLNPDLNNYDAMEAFNIVTDVHTDLKQVEEMLNRDFPYQSFYIYFEGGYYLNLANTWDLSSVKAGVPGIYAAYRRPALPQGILMEDILEAVCSINIQDPDVFTLSSPISFGNNIAVSWLYPTPDPSLFRLRYRIGNGDWVIDTDEYFMCLHSNEDGSISLFLNTWEMEKDIHYQFQLEYDGVYSDILKLCVNQDGFYIPNEGDEDGSDRDNQTPPDVIQPPQNTSETPETDTSTAATWSGSRIMQYIKASPGLPLVFEKDLIRVTIPADSPALLNLSDSDFLHVEIHALSAVTLRLTVSLNEADLTGIPMTVTMPWAEENEREDLRIKDESGEWIGKVDELSTEGSITFTVTQSGVYTILPYDPEGSTTEKGEYTPLDISLEVPSRQAGVNLLPVIGIPAILALGSIIVIIFIHYKRKKD